MCAACVPCYNRSMSGEAKGTSEKALYQPVKNFLHGHFSATFGNCHLEITASGQFEESLKRVMRHDIIFSFLGRKASPDLVGFIRDEYGIKDYIVTEIKRGRITLQDVYQTKMYGDLFAAKHSLLISPVPVPEEIKRLHKSLFILNRFMQGWMVCIGEWNEVTDRIVDDSWFPKAPF